AVETDARAVLRPGARLERRADGAQPAIPVQVVGELVPQGEVLSTAAQEQITRRARKQQPRRAAGEVRDQEMARVQAVPPCREARNVVEPSFGCIAGASSLLRGHRGFNEVGGAVESWRFSAVQHGT